METCKLASLLREPPHCYLPPGFVFYPKWSMTELLLWLSMFTCSTAKSQHSTTLHTLPANNSDGLYVTNLTRLTVTYFITCKENRGWRLGMRLNQPMWCECNSRLHISFCKYQYGYRHPDGTLASAIPGAAATLR